MLLCPVVLGTKKFCFHPTGENFRSSFRPCPGFLGGSQACLPAPCVSARLPPQGPRVDAFTSSFCLENRSFPTKYSLVGEGALESLHKKSSQKKEPGWDLRSRARVPPQAAGTGATNLPSPGARGAAVQDNVYFLSLITRFFLKKKKKISFGSKIVFMIQSDKTEHMLV